MIKKIRARLNLRRHIRTFGDTVAAHMPQWSNHSNAVLIIRLDGIGDFILWLDSAKEYRKIFPDKKIVLLANTMWAGLAECLPYWDEIIPIERNRLSDDLIYRYKFFNKIRKRRFQIAIHPAFSREYLIGDSLIRMSGAIQKIGVRGHMNQSYRKEQDKSVSDAWYTKLIPGDKAPMMELKRNAEFIRGLGVKDFESHVPKIEKLLDLPPSLKIAKPYCVIFPGAGWKSRMWPSAKYAELIRRISASSKWQVVLCGGHDEKIICERIIELSERNAVNLAGKTSLVELVEIIRNANLVVGNETSAIHIAAATDTPAVCILGGGHFERFLPYSPEITSYAALPVAVFKKMDCYGCDWKCIYPSKQDNPTPLCIDAIDVKQVEKACAQIISKAS